MIPFIFNAAPAAFLLQLYYR